MGNCVRTTSSIVVRRIFLERIGGFDAALGQLSGLDLYIRLSRVCRFDFLPELLGQIIMRMATTPSHNQ